MENRMVNGVMMKVPFLPWNVRDLGFRSADHVQSVAQKFGKIVAPMKVDDVAEWYAKGNR